MSNPSPQSGSSSSPSFLEQVAIQIVNLHGSELHNVLIILPNRRSAVFLKRHLAQHCPKPSWIPQITGIEDFVALTTGRSIPDELSLHFRLFDVWCKANPDKEPDFEDFLRWAGIMLSDFNQTDLYLADARDLFQNLNEARALEMWSPGKIQLTAFQKNYLEFFNTMWGHYCGLREILDQNGEGYFGMLCRMLVEEPHLMEPIAAGKHIFLAGFNALSLAEEQIFNHLFKNYKAKLLWDADYYYLDKAEHEAGIFLRHYREKWGKEGFSNISDNFHPQRNINIYGLPGNVSQVKAAANLLQEMAQENQNLEQTALILADEKLLFPSLNAIPQSIASFNVTMGYPIRVTSAYHLISNIFQLHINARRLKRKSKEGILCFYFADFKNLIGLPAFRLLFEPKQITQWLEFTNTSNKAFLNPEELSGTLQEDSLKNFQLLFSNYDEDLRAFTSAIKQLLYLLANRYASEEESKLDETITLSTAHIFERLEIILQQAPFIKKTETLRKIFNNLIATQKLPFEGEPVEGLQIMGFLESRCLDFKNLIILSANEGILPKTTHHNSFIPHDLRAGFGLPGISENDAVFAYHFYRLIQRAENCHIFYNTDSDVLSRGEKSRYLTQMEYEMGLPHDKFRIEIVPFADISKAASVIIPKDKSTLLRLREIAKKGLSPTSLNAYRNCSLRFWLSHVAEIRESEATEETIEARTMGQVIHKVIENFFKPFEGQVVHKSHIEEMLLKVGKEVENTFEEIYFEGDITQGQNHLILQVSRRFIENYLKQEMLLVERLANQNQYLSIVKLEEELEAFVPIYAFDKEPLEVRLKGFADRIDSCGGVKRIIDYKTGRVEEKKLKLKNWDELISPEEASERDIAFQLLMYKWLYAKMNPELRETAEAVVISMRKPADALPVVAPAAENQQDASSSPFEDILLGIVEEIFNPDVPFTQTKNESACKNCLFKAFCMRLDQVQ